MSHMVLTVIGGGSVNWMRGLMRDVYLLDCVESCDIRLVDPYREHVEAVAGMLRAFNRMRGRDWRIAIVDDRREALDGADFVMTTFSPGRMDAFRNDLEIPIRYGIRQPVSMTVGPSGISASLRTAPVAYGIVRDMEEMCPDAWLLNVTNPMSVVTRAMTMAARRVRVIGMCHGLHDEFPRTVGRMLGLPQPEGMNVLDYLYDWLPSRGLEYTVAGLNHFIWLTRCDLGGEDMLPVIRRYVADHTDMADGDPNAGPVTVWRNNYRAGFAMCRAFGYMPLAADRHLVEFWPSLCNVRNGYGMAYDVHKTTVDYRLHDKDIQLDWIRRVADGRETVDWTRSGEEMTRVMEAIITGGSTTGIVNVPNRGQIAGLPRDVVVETLATVGADGVGPRDCGELPGAVGTLCRLHADVHELTVRAALEGSRELFLRALSLDPLSAGADFAELGRLADDLLDANREWLPRFFT